jgi:vacuolar-type H+-ATPase subunit H
MAKKKKSRAKPAKKRVVKPARKSARKIVRKTKKRAAAPAKKAAARPAKKTKAKRRAREVLGEGNYTASRRFRKDETGFVARNRSKIPAMGKAAELALEGPEGDALRNAEDEARAHAHMPEG